MNHVRKIIRELNPQLHMHFGTCWQLDGDQVAPQQLDGRIHLIKVQQVIAKPHFSLAVEFDLSFEALGGLAV